MFWPIFVDSQNEAASLCFKNSINKDVKRTFMVSCFNPKSYLFNRSRIFETEAMEAVL